MHKSIPASATNLLVTGTVITFDYPKETLWEKDADGNPIEPKYKRDDNLPWVAFATKMDPSNPNFRPDKTNIILFHGREIYIDQLHNLFIRSVYDRLVYVNPRDILYTIRLFDGSFFCVPLLSDGPSILMEKYPERADDILQNMPTGAVAFHGFHAQTGELIGSCYHCRQVIQTIPLSRMGIRWRIGGKDSIEFVQWYHHVFVEKETHFYSSESNNVFEKDPPVLSKNHGEHDAQVHP